jgi:hypothetical protein
LEVKDQQFLSFTSQRGGTPPTPFSHGYILLNPCAGAEVQEDVHMELTKMWTLQQECLGNMDRNVHGAGA